MAEVKFYRKKGTEIRKVALVDEADNRKVVAFIGKVGELVDMGIIEAAPGLDEQAWIILEKPKTSEGFVELELVNYPTLGEAKRECLKVYGEK